MADIARAAGRPLTYVLLQDSHDPDWFIESAKLADKYSSEGAEIWPQVSARQITLFAHLDNYHPFRLRPTYMKLHDLPRAEKARLMRDPDTKRAILSEEDVSIEQAATPAVYHIAKRYQTMLDTLYAIEMPIDYEPDESKRLDHLAAKFGKSMIEYLYDHLVAGDGRQMAVQHVHNYARGNLQDTYELLKRDRVISGLGDGGAHLGISCDAAMSSFQLSFWTRDRTRGPKMPLESIVRKISADGAALYGLTDRGTLAPGKRADINVVDMKKISVDLPELKFDLPEGGPRFVQASHGFVATLVNGAVTRRFDEDCGARPGRLLRSGR
jgi:N-acyl-D-aspartate/D-glutamate deacylase